MLQRLLPLLEPQIVHSTIKPCLHELAGDPDVDVSYYAKQALMACDESVQS